MSANASQKPVSKLTIPVISTDLVSDGYHTFGELYEHRITLFIALCKQLWDIAVMKASQTNQDTPTNVWRSQKHSDGEIIFPDEHGYASWFVMGIGREKGEQITYHLPLDKWEDTNFAETLDKAPEFDGHTPEDVLDRLENL